MAKRGNPLASAAKRVQAAAASADSTMMSRMPRDFQRMHNPKRKNLASAKKRKTSYGT